MWVAGRTHHIARVSNETLAQMSILVEQQDEQITVINDTVKDVEKDVETGCVLWLL